MITASALPRRAVRVQSLTHAISQDASSSETHATERRDASVSETRCRSAVPVLYVVFENNTFQRSRESIPCVCLLVVLVCPTNMLYQAHQTVERNVHWSASKRFRECGRARRASGRTGRLVYHGHKIARKSATASAPSASTRGGSTTQRRHSEVCAGG